MEAMVERKGRKPVRAYTHFYPDGSTTAKVPPKTIFGPVQEIRTNMIDGNMYLTVKVPSIQGVELEFKCVNVAYYDSGKQKFHELAKISEELAVAPKESQWQVKENQDARDPPASRFEAPAASSSSSGIPAGCVEWQYRPDTSQMSAEEYDSYRTGMHEMTTEEYDGYYEKKHGSRKPSY